jgi:hypothetical protein
MPPFFWLGFLWRGDDVEKVRGAARRHRDAIEVEAVRSSVSCEKLRRQIAGAIVYT